MKSKVLVVIMLLALLLPGCKALDEPQVTAVIFNRGHGSAWGNQFYIHVEPEQIVMARYIPAGSSELVTVEHIPITAAQWETIRSMVEQMPLEKARTDLWEKQKLDGSEFRELTLVRGKKEITYWWPDILQAQQLEQLLETLLADSVAPTFWYSEQFSVQIPAGWTAFPVEDVFSDTPGAVNPDRVNIIRGGTQPSDIKNMIHIMVDHYGPDKQMEEPGPGSLQDACRITPFQTGAYWWQGFTGMDMQGRVTLGTGAILWTRSGEHGYVVSFPLELNGQTLSLEDPALLVILESLSPDGLR